MVAPISDSTVSIANIVARLDRSRASIYRDIQRGEFPKPLRLGRSSRWLVSEIDAFIATRAAQRFE